jgi:geranylgeranyl pyrophosphate synthase
MTLPPDQFQQRLLTYTQQVETALHAQLPLPSTRPQWLHQAMHYSVMAGGKRLRPCLLLGAQALFPGKLDPMPAAVSLECLHTYTLIHDDLPCMDDSDLRRGQPTCHKKFDEATALLAGDGLLTWALYHLANSYASEPTVAVGLVQDLGRASGSEHLIGGQMEDLLGEKEAPTQERLQYIHLNKTAALIEASLTMGLRLSSAPEGLLGKMQQLGRDLGLAFQIIDDLLDVTSDAQTMGKPVGADADNAKMTYPALYGLEASYHKANEHTQAARSACEEIGGENGFLLALIDHMAKRIS